MSITVGKLALKSYSYLVRYRLLEILPGIFANESVEQTSVAELLPECNHFGIEFLVHWRQESVCLSLGRGVSLCPRRAVEAVHPTSGFATYFPVLQERNF
jgi:hypothetical protein